MAEYMDMGTSLSKALEANEIEVKTESNDSTKGGEGKKIDGTSCICDIWTAGLTADSEKPNTVFRINFVCKCFMLILV